MKRFDHTMTYSAPIESAQPCAQARADVGTITQRVGKDSQLPFGHCCLSLQPAMDAVVRSFMLRYSLSAYTIVNRVVNSPSGHIYSREAILEYILHKSRELKAAAAAFEDEQVCVCA